MTYINPRHLLDIMIGDIAANADFSTSDVIKGVFAPPATSANSTCR